MLTQDRWHLMPTTREDWWPRAPGSGRRRDRFCLRVAGRYHEMLRCRALGDKLQNYFGQIDIIVLLGYLRDLFIAGCYHLPNTFRHICSFYPHNNHMQ